MIIAEHKKPLLGGAFNLQDKQMKCLNQIRKNNNDTIKINPCIYECVDGIIYGTDGYGYTQPYDCPTHGGEKT